MNWITDAKIMDVEMAIKYGNQLKKGISSGEE